MTVSTAGHQPDNHTVSWPSICGNPRLVIDKISLTLNLAEDEVARIECFIDDISKETLTNYEGKQVPFHPMRGGWNYGRGFRTYLNAVLAFEKTGATAFTCQIRAKKPNVPNTRFSWNPSAVQSLDVAALVFNDYLGLDPTRLWDANVAQIDFAVDVPGLQVDDIAVSYSKLRCSENRFGSNGRTLYLGAQSGRTRVRVYDKRPQIIAANKKMGSFLAELYKPVPKHDLLRLEIELHDMGPVSKLAAVANPFSRMRVHMLPNNLTRMERALMKVSRYEGLSCALKSLEFSDGERKALLRKLDKHGTPNWWRPKELWAEQLPSVAEDFVAPFQPKP